MKRYEKYKPSGVEWIGDVPSNWNVKRGRFIIKLLPGFPADSDSFTDDDTFIPLIRIRDIDNTTTEKFYNGEFPKEYLIKKSDVLVGMDGDFNISEWKGEDALLNQRVCKVIGTNEMISHYAYYLFRKPLKLINDVTYSTTVKHLSTTDIKDFRFPVPPLEEQTAIADYLDAKCSKIDNVVEVQRKRIELLKELKQSIITHAVTKGLNKNAKLKPSGVDWIGEMPEGWEVCRLKRVLIDYQDGTHGTFARVDSDYPLLSAKNVFEDGIKISQEDSTISEEDHKSIVSNGFPQKGDIAICCVGTLGRCCIYSLDIPYAFQRSVTFLRANQKIHNSYLLYMLRSDVANPQFSMFAKTSAQSGIYMEALVNFLIICPPIEEQTSIAAYLDKKCATIDKQIGKVERQIELLKEYKQSVITECVTGKRKVC